MSSRTVKARIKARVLIVDDVPQNRLLLGLFCDELGLAHEPAENGYEAVDGARSGRFDLILMDILMPRMDGMTATRVIRAMDGPAGRVPIVAVTTASAPGEVLRYLDCGMDAVVAKPVTRAAISAAIEEALALGAAEPERRRSAA